MAGGLGDFVFGRGALKKAGGSSDPKPAPKGESANLDIAKMAQDSADRAKRSSSKKGPQKRATKR